MKNNFLEYSKRFVKRNLINGSLRNSKTKESTNLTTVTDFLLLPLLPILTLMFLLQKKFD